MINDKCCIIVMCSNTISSRHFPSLLLLLFHLLSSPLHHSISLSPFSSPSLILLFSPHLLSAPTLLLSPLLPSHHLSLYSFSFSLPPTISLTTSPPTISPSHPHYHSLPVPSMEARPLSNILFYGAKLGTFFYD
jgi:hypothetical protein